MDIFVCCETLSLTSSFLTGLPFYKQWRHSKWWMERGAAADFQPRCRVHRHTRGFNRCLNISKWRYGGFYLAHTVLCTFKQCVSMQVYPLKLKIWWCFTSKIFSPWRFMCVSLALNPTGLKQSFNSCRKSMVRVWLFAVFLWGLGDICTLSFLNELWQDCSPHQTIRETFTFTVTIISGWVYISCFQSVGSVTL